jgi:hypothetical protein
MSEADAMHERLKAEWGVWCGQWRPAESSWAERNQKSAIRDLTQATYVGSLRADPRTPCYLVAPGCPLTGAPAMRWTEIGRSRLKLLQLKQLPKMTPNLGLRLDTFRWRARAEELVHRADTMHDADAQRKIREVAADYERLAQRVKKETGEADD